MQQDPLNVDNSDDIDLGKLFYILWDGKWWLIGITFCFAIASVAIALSMSNEYKATAILKATETQGGQLGALANQFGGLASLAGINVNPIETSETDVAIEILKTWGFAENFVNKHQLQIPLFAATGWHSHENELILNEQLYNLEHSKWVRTAPKGKTVHPTSWELYKEYKERLFISKDKNSGLINVSFVHYSPYLAKEWVELLVKDINSHMKEKALDEANKSIKYLEEQIALTSVAEIRNVFSQLIQEQHKTKMLAQVSDEYTFKTISKPKVPEEKHSPKRALICILGTFLGLMFSILFLFLNYVYKRISKNRSIPFNS